MNKTSCSLNNPIKLVYQDEQNYFVRYRSGKGKTISEKELTELKKEFKFNVGSCRTVEPSKDKILWRNK